MVYSFLTPVITLNGTAKEVMEYYAQRLPDTEITHLELYRDAPAFDFIERDWVMHGEFSLMGCDYCFLDMQEEDATPGLKWSQSLYLTCQTEEEFDLLFEVTSNEGDVLMEAKAVGEYRQCACVIDRFGLRWQIVLK